MLLLLQIYLAFGLLYGAWVVAAAELARPSSAVVVPLRLRFRIYLAVLALGFLLWPAALLMDHRGGT